MWTLEKKFRFEAAHYLPNHDGKCKRMHGHSWTGTLIVQGGHLFVDGPKQGMVIDYADLSAVIEPIVEHKLDHWCLNDTLPLQGPTSEAIARWIYDEIVSALPSSLVAVRIEETCTAACEYRP